MARLAIAKGFLAEYAKLDKGVQSAVEAAVTEFAKRPARLAVPGEAAAGPGRPDPHFRVDSLWRGVVLAPG